MRAKVKVGLLVLVAVSFAACPFVAVAGEKEGVFTVFRVLVGKPAIGEAGGTSVLIVPGTVVMVGRSPEDEAKDVLDLMAKLKDSYRLGEVSLAGSLARAMVQEQGVDIPAVTGDLEVRATLLGFNEKQATYGVSISETGKVVSEPRITIARGDRGIVGSRDGAAVPYFFLTVEPLKPIRPLAPDAPGEKGEITPPRIISKVSPIFPEEARKARIDGVVILECAIGADGSVGKIKAVRSEPMGLTEAAMKAVSQWQYEPARNAKGKPVAVISTVTISFMFDRSNLLKEKAKT
jgi:TonB family protein